MNPIRSKQRNLLILGVVSLCVLAFTAVSTAETEQFWASKNGSRFHYSYCRHAKKIKEENLVKFNTVQEARNAGYKPCKLCNPK